jgi:acyl-CoA synthetase (AMP-forming)/AMP-acid ligase II
MRLETLLAGHALRRPDHPAVVCGTKRLGYAELAESIRRVASGLRKLGIGTGDRVLVYLPNGVEFVQAVYAVFSLGAIAVPVNTRLTARELEHVFADAGPAAAVYHASGTDAVRTGMRSIAGCRAVAVGGATAGETAFEALAAAPLDALPQLALDPDDCLILYTSGTTGAPKGAILTHANMIVQNVFMHGTEWGIGRDDRYLVLTPLAHRAGVSRLFNALGFGGTLVILDKFDPAGTIETIERERITVTGLVPTAIRMLLPELRRAPARCETLRRIIVSTEAFPVPLKQALLALLPRAEIHSVFGSTEALVTNLSHAEQFTHPASVGRPIPGVEVRLVDDAGRDVSEGEVGELVVRSGPPGRFATLRAYFNRPEETAVAIRDGWFHTGDLARRDAEGYLYIVDRKKDMVISGGFNIYSKEVEAALATHPSVAEAAVIGVPDEVYGEAVAAFVEPSGAGRPDAQALIEHCRTRLAGYKKPKHVFVIDALPRNSTGKVLKNELRALAAERLNPA